MTTVRGHYRFTVKERSDRSPWIAAEPAGDIIPGMGDLGAGGAVGAPAGVPGAAGNTSPTFGRSSAGGSGGFSDGTYKSEFWYEHFWRICGYAYGAHKSRGT
jgi:hypothetical protein